MMLDEEMSFSFFFPFSSFFFASSIEKHKITQQFRDVEEMKK